MHNQIILQIETATTMCSVALSAGGKLLALKEANERNIHASEITLFIDDVMTRAGITYQQLNAVAVSKGPGSYTGLRIGVSTAKGLCFALDIPLIAVNTLEAMADGFIKKYPATDPSTILCPMIDARRMEVYTAIYDANLNQLEPVAAKVLDGQTFGKYLSGSNVIFFGDGAGKTQSLYAANPNYRFIEFENSASHLSELAVRKFQNGDFEDVAYFEPFYLKDFIAGVSK
ncbi:tRNA (adenosine(37)-N6)-threonylcarbamoyltransferase complex dimerization subunit type 1 TsaB [Flavihumibacter sp. R14]|nr:tRNA (adenosine(37)-N6)-threonylcarbamoyltransferase complex dimerization subunit type 1 TsaB [Flavihumibacter soli]